MEEIILPLEGNDGQERINPKAQEINVAQLLSCSRRTVLSYVKNGILPKPLSDDGRILLFSRASVYEALGLKNLEEPIVTIKEAALILNKKHREMEHIVKSGIFTEIKLKGHIKAKRWYLKKEIEGYGIEIEEISNPTNLRNDRRFISILFTNHNLSTMELIASKKEIDIMKKVLLDKISYEDIGKEYEQSSIGIHRIFDKALRRFERRLKHIIPIIREMEKKNALKKMEEQYAERFNELERKIVYVNSMIKDAELKIIIAEKLENIIVPPEHEMNKDEYYRNLFMTKIANLGFSFRVINGFRYAGIYTLEKLVSFTTHDLKNIPNFGQGSLDEVINILKPLGLELGMFSLLTDEEITNLKKKEKKKLKYEEGLKGIDGLNDLDDIQNERIYKLLMTNVEDCDISIRLMNVCRNAKIKTLLNLVEYKESELMRLRNFGETCLLETRRLVKSLGLRMVCN